MAYYLKYRPQKISDLDIKEVSSALGEILAAKDVPHAFLFVGPKGTGKTSAARIVAKAVNCTAKRGNPPAGGEPCNKCEACLSLSRGNALDLIEIDAASNRGIDDIRDLREKIRLAPANLSKKVYIIDEAHMLTKEAFNALLKTLEEPPEHAVFVLCTTQAEKIPGTIASRCWQVNFRKANLEEIIMALTRVVKGEKLKISLNDLRLIAKQAGGSFRDAVKILEQLAAAGKKISSAKVGEVLKTKLMGEELDDWLVLVYQKEVNKALEWLRKAGEQGIDVKQLAINLVERLRQVLFLRLGVEEEASDIDELKDKDEVKKLLALLAAAAEKIKGAVIESLPLELAVVEWSASAKASEDKGGNPSPPSPEPDLKTKSGKLSLKAVEDRWDEVLKALRPHNHSLEALLRATKPTGFDGKNLVLEVFYRFHKERLEIARYRELVETVASKVLKSPVGVRYYLSEKGKKSNDDDIIKTAQEVFGGR